MLILCVLGIFIAVAYAGYVQTFEHDRETRKEMINNKDEETNG